MKDDLFALQDYNLWANKLLLESLAPLPHEEYVRELGGGWPSIRAALVHLAGATRAWAERFDGRDATTLPAVEEVPSLADAARMLNEADARVSAFLAARTPEQLAAPLVWKNLRGEEKAAPLWTVLRHTANHATYHRGQIAAMLKRVGGKPLATDLVRWAIERHEAGAFGD
ncbi:MAG: DinB family protein [Holophagales bacterium]|jgi:uncharacterized damage-inducible protein DinB|nr:DinB family protein [Holophagales bacterium]